MKTEFINILPVEGKWKEECMSKLEIMFDTLGNDGMPEFNDLCDEKLEWGKKYRIKISIEEIT